MNALMKMAMVVAGLAVATPTLAQVSFYEHEDFQGRSFNSERKVPSFRQAGFNDRASSVVVLNSRWEACEHDRYDGRCVVLRPGRYPTLKAMGLNDRVSSVRPVGRDAKFDERRYAPAPIAVYDNHRRRNERTYEADVTSVRAVSGPPEQRCWIEHERGAASERGANVPGALAGAVLGGILGHQVGGGSGKDIATAGGAVAGAAIGANVGRGDQQWSSMRDVQRCENVQGQGRTEYWDVTYIFRGVMHRIQMTSPPENTVTVNSRGEPRA